MTRRPNDTLTPFEETLTNLPAEPAPANLQDRCLAALDAAQVTAPVRRPAPWTQLSVAAVASVLLVLIIAPVFMKAHEKARGSSRPRMEMAQELAPPPAAPGAPTAMGTRVASSDRFAVGKSPAPGGAPPAGPAGPAAAMPAPAARAERAQAGDEAGAEDNLSEREAKKIARMQPRQPAPGAPPPVETVVEPAGRSVVPPPAQPWYDRSTDRQKIVHRDMTIEAPDVEDCYHRVVTAIEKAGGYLEREDLTVTKGQPDRATIAARVPAAAFDAVVQQLRDMGKLVRLTGSSEDRTQEYKSRGVDIRALSAAEQDLIERLNREQNEARKQALKWELESLRKTLHDEKQALLDLAAETAFAHLNIEIVEGSGFWHGLKEKSADALPFAMAAALVALPFLVVMLLWRRRG